MIKPPAMGVFARDPPTTARGGASPASSATHLPQPSADPSSSSSRLLPADEPPSDPINPEEEPAQDDDDQGTVDEEAGVIRCICGCDDDDGFTIQCDRCLVWQHCACFGMSQASVPDEYLCEQCDPRPVDVAFAQAHQQKRKNNEARKALMDRNLKRQAQALASNNYTQTYLAQDAVPSPTSSTHAPSASTAAQEATSATQQPAHPASISTSAAAARSRKPSQALDLTNTQFVVPELPASVGTAQRGGSAKQRKGQKGSRRGFDTPSSVSTPVRGVFTPGSSHERADDPFDLADQLEAWHVEFTPVTKNTVAEPSIVENLAMAMLDWEEGSPLKAVQGPAGRAIAPTAYRLSHSSKLAHSEIYPSSSSTSSPSSPSPRALGSPIPEAALIGISAVGQECIPVEMSGPSLADLACRTYVKHISESASAGVFSNLLYVNNSADEPQRSWCASRAFSRPVMHGLFADGSIPAGAFITELRGELYSADAYRNNPINQYAALGATKPHVHLLPPPLNLAIDARRYGNEARFARFSCHPNAVLRPILFRPNGQSSARSRTSSRAQSPAATLALSSRHSRHADTPPVEIRSDEPQLVFGLFALTDIPRTHEITLGWEWDDAHIVHFLPELVQNPFLESRHLDVDANQHTANMVALAEKGEFPYAETEFSAKMSTVAAALLGSVLCACIGSAAPPGGGGGASANNGRKQDCAVAQMLRVGNGMSLLNVNMPGKANRRAKLPDFSPLVGVRRYWRPYSLPPTPETSAKDSASPVDHAVLDALAPEAGTLNGMDVDDEMGCGSNEKNARRGKRRKGDRAKQDRMQVDGDLAASDADDGDDTRSIASSLTDPLSGLSDDDTLSEEEDHDLMDALRAADDLPSRRRPGNSGDADAVDTELSGLFLLPPKKRSMRTRIKAILAPSDDDEAMDEQVADRDEEVQRSKGVKGTTKVKAGAKRKGKADPGRAAPDFSSDEDKDDGGYDSTTTPIKKRRKAGNIVDPSSPLSSVPSPHTDDSNASPPTPVPRLSKKNRLETEKRMSDVELSKKKRAAKRGGDRKGKTSEPRPKESASKRRKREEARIHRNAILDLGDSESSQDDLSEQESAEEEDNAVANADSRASTPRAAAKQAKNVGDATGPKKAKRDLLPSSPIVAEDQTLAKEDTPTKTKKVRRIVSDSEASSDGEEAAPAPLEEEEIGSKQEPAVAASKPEAVDSKPAEANLKIETDTAKLDAAAASLTSKAAATSAPAPAPVPEVKKEEPRVKLSLAEYKRRLAERRVSAQQVPTSSSGPLTPSLATPTSEVTPSPSPAVEGSNPLPSSSLRSSEPPSVMAAGAETISTPTGVIPPAISSVPVITEPAKPPTASVSAAAPRSVLFTSISAPTAIRSVEIPKSPSPEPAPAQVPAGGASLGAASAVMPSQEVLAPVASSIEAGTVSSTAGPASSPASNTSTLPSAGAGSDTPALLMRLETIRGRAASVSQQPGGGDKDPQQQGTAGNVAAADVDGFAKPQSHSTAPTTAPTTPGLGATSSTPMRSPSLGPIRVQPPHSPSGSATFNPPRGPRAFMSPPSASLAPSSMAPTSSVTAGSVSSAAAPALSSAAAPVTSPAVTSTPARIGIAGVAAGMANTPSSASSASSTASTRYAPPSLTSPTPATTALPRSAGGYPPRDYAGVPKGPSSMRDADPRADAWAEAREAREARGGDYYGAPPRHHDSAGAGRDMGWGERPREPAAGWGRRDPTYRDAPPAGAGYARDEAAYPYRRPSATEYDDAGGPAYDRPADPYNRGIVVRGRSLIGGGGAAPPAAGTAQPPAREYREYDEGAPRGGYRGGGWGGRGRPRGGRGRGWMR